MNKATTRQIDYIISLCNQVTGRRDAHLSHVRNVREVMLSSGQVSRGITSAQASAMIDALKARLGIIDRELTEAGY